MIGEKKRIHLKLSSLLKLPACLCKNYLPLTKKRFYFKLKHTHRRPEETGSKAGNPPCHCKCNLFKCSIFQEIPFGAFPPMKGRTLKCSSGPSE